MSKGFSGFSALFINYREISVTRVFFNMSATMREQKSKEFYASSKSLLQTLVITVCISNLDAYPIYYIFFTACFTFLIFIHSLFYVSFYLVCVPIFFPFSFIFEFFISFHSFRYISSPFFLSLPFFLFLLFLSFLNSFFLSFFATFSFFYYIFAFFFSFLSINNRKKHIYCSLLFILSSPFFLSSFIFHSCHTISFSSVFHLF